MLAILSLLLAMIEIVDCAGLSSFVNYAFCLMQLKSHVSP